MKSLTKKNVLILSLIGSIFAATVFLVGTNFCYQNEICRGVRNMSGNENLIVTFVFPLMFIFSLITFWMKEEVFRSWFKFAGWSVPLVVITAIWLNTLPESGGFFNLDNAIILLAMIIMGVIFAIVSISNILFSWLKYYKNKDVTLWSRIVYGLVLVIVLAIIVLVWVKIS
jgi:hypothetical protein